MSINANSLEIDRPLRLDDQLCFSLYAATNAVVRSYRPRLKKLGLTYPQYLVMLVLWQDGPSSMATIAARLRLAANSITPLVERLEQAGYVERALAVSDRRRHIVALTLRGQHLENSTSLEQEQVQCDTGLSDDDLAKLRTELHALANRLERRLMK